jgi:hypothetical protein
VKLANRPAGLLKNELPERALAPGVALHKAFKEMTMRTVGFLTGVVLFTAFAGTAHADPYRWCAEYGGGRGGATNCYFITLQQCQAAISGNGGFCRQNGFYTGPERRGGGRYGMRKGANS